jgi:putative transposase
MKIVKAYKYKLKTNLRVENKLNQISGSCRFVYNLFLNQRVQEYKTDYVNVNYYDQAIQLPLLKEEYPWLKEAPSQVLQQKLKDLDQAYKNFFRRCKKGEVPGFPKYHKKGIKDSFRYPQGVKVERNKVYLPKVGWLKFLKSRDIAGKIKNTTISEKCGSWYISFQTEVNVPDVIHVSTSTIGIDRGVKIFAVGSDNTEINFNSNIDKYYNQLKFEQRKLARKKKFSSNWTKQKDKISKMHNKIANIRNDFLHKESTKLSKNHAVIVLEKLKIKNMSKSAKGTIEEPGRNVKAKSGLNRVILKQGLYTFQSMLEYKQKYSGGAVIYVNPKNTSTTCSVCGHISKENRVSQSTFSCKKCGFSANADYNAAKNIKDRAVGQTVPACGESA